MRPGLMHSLRKNWAKGILIILVIGMSSATAVVAGASWYHSLEYGSVQYGCKNLVGSVAPNPQGVINTTVRYIRFTCPSGPAVNVSPGPATCIFCAAEPPFATLIPVFTLPHGVLGLWAFYSLADSCPTVNPTIPGYMPSPLISGKPIIYSDRSLNYCVAVDRSVGTVSPFNIECPLDHRPFLHK